MSCRLKTVFASMKRSLIITESPPALQQPPLPTVRPSNFALALLVLVVVLPARLCRLSLLSPTSHTRQQSI